MQKKEYSLEFGGRTLTASFTDLADQTNGSVIIKYGETVVLVTAVMSKEAKEGMGYFPLTVDYEEKFYASGRILGSRFIKREGRPSDEAILTGRVVDRTIRPLFESHTRNEVHVVVTVLSIDEENDPDVPAIIGASLALGTSDIPWKGPVSAVRLGSKNGDGEKIMVNPTYPDRENSHFDLLACGKDGKVNMIEAEAKEVKEKKVEEALSLALSEIEKLQSFQQRIISETGKKKIIISKPVISDEIKKLFEGKISPKMEETVMGQAGKAGKASIHAIEDEWLALVMERFPEANKNDCLDYCSEAVNNLIHKEAIENKRRADGRKMNEVRPIYAQAGELSSVVHGAGVFYRGGTHILTVLTLSGPKDSQIIEGMEVRGKKYFMHHYNFPPFSSGETGRMGGTNRRAVGHGALAEKALRAIIPSRDEFPYTIRLVSESMASNGSTSMGSVCASTLALMDGGVPVKNPVAGIAIGLMTRETSGSLTSDNYQILTDIQGPEDEYGDMDFKIAGSKEGITAIQLDIKLDGVPVPILIEALGKAREAREHILEKMLAVIPEPRKELYPSAPRITIVKIAVDKIGLLIGSGGKTINGIIEETGAEIEIEEDGSVYITGKNEAVEKAKEAVESITHDYKVGEKFEGEVIKVLDFGLVAGFGRGQEGLIHISEIAPYRVDRLDGFFAPGDKVPIIIKEIDPERGKISLSVKGADPSFAGKKGLKETANMGYNSGNNYGRNDSKRRGDSKGGSSGRRTHS